MKGDTALRIFLCGDVMTGRGIDQVLPHPASPELFESYVKDARDYVFFAEKLNGAISRPVDFAYVWGDSLEELTSADARIINLETSITDDGSPWPDKGIHYRMSPRNIPCLTSAHIDCCCLANNHVLDWGYAGLADTLKALDTTAIAHAGVGKNSLEADAPAALPLPRGRRILVWAVGARNSGIPLEWNATEAGPGLSLLPDLSVETARGIGSRVQAYKHQGDIAIVSVHWGGNWGYELPPSQVAFARQLIDDGVDLVHGHSSHHAKAQEVYRGRLILYGCGDFITDYEGIGGYEEFRGDLSLMYLAKLDSSGSLLELRMVPMHMHRFRLSHSSRTDAVWLCNLLNELDRRFACEVDRTQDNSLMLRW
jgi:poly-gamma-glutamate synthesis protein (capsule biosynthesis protein)